MTAGHLLDANALIALVVEDHEHHAVVRAWVKRRRLAVSPVVEGALVRFLVRAGESHATATAVLRALRESGRCEFLPDSLSYADADLAHVVGHRQVTDAYLAALARHHGSRLATLDKALAGTLPGVDLIKT